MDLFLKTAAIILLAVVLGLTLAKQEKDLSLLMIMTVCCIAASTAMHYLKDVLQFLDKLEQIGQFNSDILDVLLKSVGISLVAEISVNICADAGNASLGRVLQMVSSMVILWLSLPLFNELIALAEEILGQI